MTRCPPTKMCDVTFSTEIKEYDQRSLSCSIPPLHRDTTQTEKKWSQCQINGDSSKEHDTVIWENHFSIVFCLPYVPPPPPFVFTWAQVNPLARDESPLLSFCTVIRQTSSIFSPLFNFLFFCTRTLVNTSHVINHLSFGTDYPGLKNPLDGEMKVQY